MRDMIRVMHKIIQGKLGRKKSNMNRKLQGKGSKQQAILEWMQGHL
jgi:hypothetical protein